MDQTTTSDWVTARAAMDQAGISRRCLYNWLAKGKLHWRRNAGGSLYIFAPSLWEGYDGARTPWSLRPGAGVPPAQRDRAVPGVLP